MTSCDKYIEMISRSIDSELEAGEGRELEAHLETCAECRAVKNAFEAISGAVRETAAEAPDALLDSVMSRLGEAPQKPRRVYSFSRFVRYGALAACLALVAIAGYEFLGPGFSGGGTASDSPAAGSADSAIMYSAAAGAAAPQEESPEAERAYGEESAGKSAGEDMAGGTSGNFGVMFLMPPAVSYTSVSVESGGEELFSSEEASVVSDFAENLLIAGGVTEAVPARDANYTVLLENSDTGLASAFFVWIEDERLLWTDGTGAEALVSPAGAAEFLAYLE